MQSRVPTESMPGPELPVVIAIRILRSASHNKIKKQGTFAALNALNSGASRFSQSVLFSRYRGLSIAILQLDFSDRKNLGFLTT